MTIPDLAGLHWFKAKASESANGCIEIAHLPTGGVAVRHSKQPEDAVLVFTAHEWDCFLDGARKREFDRPAAT